MIIINIKSITQEASSINIEIADPSEYYQKNRKPYDSGSITNSSSIYDCFVDYNENSEVIRDKYSNPVHPISLESLQKEVQNIRYALDNVQKLIDKAKSTDPKPNIDWHKVKNTTLGKEHHEFFF